MAKCAVEKGTDQPGEQKGRSAKHGPAEELGWSTPGTRRLRSGAQDRGPSLSLFFEEM